MMTAGGPASRHDTEGGGPDDASPEGGGGAGPVELQLPPAAGYLRLARYAAADAATRAGLGIDDTDDVRLAVSELCSLLTGSGTPITLRFEAADGLVVVHGQGAPGPEHSGENGVLARTLAEAVVDEFRFDAVDERAAFRFTKQRSGEREVREVRGE